jgi:aspartate/methionine/tyrosine aminotransferase
VAQDRVCHAEGTSLANHLAMATILQPGDEVLLEDPTYGLLADTARYFGAVIRRFPRRREDQFQPDWDALRQALTPRTRLIILTNLHNPSSARVPDERLSALAEEAGKAGAWVLVDEVYLDATFDSAAVTAHRWHDRIIATSSLTKVYGLSGLRCGWVVAQPELIEVMWRLNDLFGVIPAHAAERLSLLALQRLPQIRARSRQLLSLNRERWNAFVSARADLETGPLEFGTVVFPRLREGGVDRLCEILRERYETTVAPGHFFGVPDSFRVGLGLPGEVFDEGLRRLGEALDDLRRENERR